MRQKRPGTRDLFGDQGPGTCRRAKRAAAFTLIELLVAAAITVMLAGFIAILVRNVGSTWTRAGTRLGADAQARIVLDQLQQDLEGAMYRDDGNIWMAADVLTGATGGATGGLWIAAQRNPKPTGGISLDMAATRAELVPQDRSKLEQARFGTAGVWLRFFTTRRGANSNANTISAPIAVGYQIVRRYSSANNQNLNTAYLLHRVEVRPAATTGNNPRPGVLETGYDITAAPYRSSTSGNNGAQSGDPRNLQIVTATQRNLDSVITDNVIDFGVRCYVRDPESPGRLRPIFPANASGGLNNSASPLRAQFPSNTPSSAPNYNHRFLFPDVIDVMVRILTDEGAALIANMERNQTPALTAPLKYRNNIQQWWWGVAQENSRVYTRRIVINARPL
ncbi:MAG: prepilin-type N-terminal cleavage/methylation domain-containing protein [Opitutaceae bacterium]|nr:prepilin-type N-terminal cleavage/methylation domain-containing protein [Opitutaceae bacterium]